MRSLGVRLALWYAAVFALLLLLLGGFLYAALDETNKTGAKVAALSGYFASAGPADAAWAVYFLVGRRPHVVDAAGAVGTPLLAA